MTLLRTEGLTRDFGGLRAVDHVDLSVEPNRVHGLIGPNGAGKTTLVSLICGRLAPSAGRIVFAGEDITRLPAERRVARGIAYTFQTPSVFQSLSVLDNVRLAGGGPSALERVGLAGRADAPASDLAHGHRRLLELAMVLALRPRLLILDEPTQGLAEGEIRRFADLVRALVADATVLLIEHNIPVVMELASRITVLDRGRILADGPPERIAADDAVQAAYLGGG